MPLLYSNKVLNLRSLQASGASWEGLQPLPEWCVAGYEGDGITGSLYELRKWYPSITSCVFISQSLNPSILALSLAV